MILGMSIYAFTVVHVVISLIGIAAGTVVVRGMISGNRLEGWTAVFLLTTALTTITGFMFPITVFTPALGVGIVSALVLVITLLALYVFRLAGSWRWIYVAGALMAFYLNAFVAVVQSFQKLPFLHALAPTESEPPFVIAHTVLLVLFVIFGILSVRKFKPMAKLAA